MMVGTKKEINLPMSEKTIKNLSITQKITLNIPYTSDALTITCLREVNIKRTQIKAIKRSVYEKK